MPEHLDLAAVDIDGLAVALQDQESYEYWSTFDPQTGEIGFGSSDSPAGCSAPSTAAAPSVTSRTRFADEHPDPPIP